MSPNRRVCVSARTLGTERSRRFRRATLCVLAGMICLPWFVQVAEGAAITKGRAIQGTRLSTAPSGFIPPDTMGGVNDKFVVELINGSFRVYNKFSTGPPTTSTSLNTFWTNAFNNVLGPAGGAALVNFAFDPRVVYDPKAKHWFATAVDNNGASNSILVGVSNSDDPTAGWRAWKIASDPTINTNPNNTLWADFPTLGIDKDGIYISARMFDTKTRIVGGNVVRDPMFANEKVIIVSIPKTTLLNGTFNPATAAHRQIWGPGTAGLTPANYGISVQPAVDFLGNTDNKVPLLATHPTNVSASGFLNSTSQIDLSFITNPQNGGGVLDNPRPAAQNIGIPLSASPPNARQSGANDNINTGQPRFTGNVVAFDKYVFAVQSIANAGRAAIEWHRVDLTNNTRVTGVISHPTLDLYYPSIAVNEFGDLVIGYSGSDNATFIGTYASVGKNAGAGPTFNTNAIQLKAGLANFLGAPPPARNRWGDYSATVADTVNPHMFWTFQEYAETPPAGSTGDWGVHMQQLLVDGVIWDGGGVGGVGNSGNLGDAANWNKASDAGAAQNWIPGVDGGGDATVNVLLPSLTAAADRVVTANIATTVESIHLESTPAGANANILRLVAGKKITSGLTIIGDRARIDGAGELAGEVRNLTGATILSSAGDLVIDGIVKGQAGSTIKASTGNMTLGSLHALGFDHQGTLEVGANRTVTLIDQDRAWLGALTTLGDATTDGTLVAVRGVELSSGDKLTGRGLVDASVKALAGSTLEANGKHLRLGSSSLDPKEIELWGAVKALGGGKLTLNDPNFVLLRGQTTVEGASSEITAMQIGHGGTMEVKNGGVVSIDDILDNSSSATITIDGENSVVKVIGSGGGNQTVNNGTITVQNKGLFKTPNLQNARTVTITGDQSKLQIPVGGITNIFGTITAQAMGDIVTTTLTVEEGTVTITGAGSLLEITSFDTGPSLVVEDGGKLQVAAGAAMDHRGEFLNEVGGTFEVIGNDSTASILSAAMNRGTLTIGGATGGGTAPRLTVGGVITNEGTFTVKGKAQAKGVLNKKKVTLDPSTLTLDNGDLINEIGGSLEGEGTLEFLGDADFVNMTTLAASPMYDTRSIDLLFDNAISSLEAGGIAIGMNPLGVNDPFSFGSLSLFNASSLSLVNDFVNQSLSEVLFVESLALSLDSLLDVQGLRLFVDGNLESVLNGFIGASVIVDSTLSSGPPLIARFLPGSGATVVTAVPEPASVVLLLSMAAIGMLHRRGRTCRATTTV